MKEVIKDNEKLVNELSRLSGQPRVKIEADLKRDFYLTAQEAASYGTCALDAALDLNNICKAYILYAFQMFDV